ncbi:MAG: AMP-binding protein [Clostridia bacterium]|nr:AMP-binding protein [Clostridia bacterium]
MDKKFLYDFVPIRDLKSMLEEVAARNPDHNAFLRKIDGEYRGISYGKFLGDVNALGTKLLDMGLKGAFIGVIGENRYEWAAAYLAVVNGTGVVVPLDKELGVRELTYLANESGLSMVVYSDKYRDVMREVARSCPGIKYLVSMDEAVEGELSFESLVSEGNALIEKGAGDFLDAQIDPLELRMLLYTSGTTGVAKGVMLNHRNIAFDIAAMKRILRISSDDTSLSILPIYHTFECTCGFLTMIASGGTVAFCEGLKYIAQNIREAKPTILIVVPLILESVYSKIMKKAEASFIKKIVFKILLGIGGLMSIDARRKLFKTVHESLGGRIHHVISGASALSPKVSKTFERMGLIVLQGYGLTECAPVAAGNREAFFKHGALGLPLPGVEMKINEPDRDGIGEILIKGDNVMMGYYKNPEETAKSIKDGWLYSGDYGRVDKDGFYIMTGRKKNLIITKTGKNIFPEELEEYLNDSPFILESVITGSEKDITKEDFIHAHIVPNIEKIKESISGRIPSLEEIKQIIGEEVKKINKKLPVFKRIKIFHIREEEFEKTTTKKIKRHAKND